MPKHTDLAAWRQRYPLMLAPLPTWAQPDQRRMRRSKGRHAEPSTIMRYYDMPSRAVLWGGLPGKHRAGRRVAV